MTSTTSNLFNGDLRMKVNGVGGNGGYGTQAPAPSSGGSGKPGGMVIYEDIG